MREVYQLERRTLANGLRLVLAASSEVPLIAIELWLDAGSRWDPVERSGLAHLCEHLVFTGPAIANRRRYAGFPALLQRTGGWISASSTHDQVAFRELLPAYELDLGLWVAGERLSADLADALPASLEVQRRILLQERRQRVDNAMYGSAFERLHRLLYPADHPYHRPPAGSPAGIRAITARDVRGFFAARYRPAGAILVITGDLEPETTWPRVERFLGSLPTSEPAAQAPSPPQLAEVEGHAVVVERVPRARCYCALRAPGFGRPGWHAVSLLLAGLALDRASPLRQQLIATAGAAQQVQAHLMPMRDASTLVLIATAAAGVRHQRLAEALSAAVDRLHHGFDEGMLRRAKKKALLDHYSTVQRPIKRATLCARLTATRSSPWQLASEADRFRAVTLADIRRYARELSRSGNRVLLSIVPQAVERRGVAS